MCFILEHKREDKLLPKALFFDLDDTILAFHGVSRPAWKQVCSHFAGLLSVKEKDLFNAIKTNSIWFWSNPERHRKGRLDMIIARREVVKKALNDLKIKDKDIAYRIADMFSDLRFQMIYVFPKALETLTAISEKHIRLALITNGSLKDQRAKIERFKLAAYFDKIFIEGELGFGKPDLRVFRKALDFFNLNPEQAWMTGDNLEWDIMAPQKLGIYSIWNDFNDRGLPSGSEIIPDKIINNILASERTY